MRGFLYKAHSLGKCQKEQSLNKPHISFWGHKCILNWMVVGKRLVLYFLCLEMEFSKTYSKKRGSTTSCFTEVLTNEIMNVAVIQTLHGVIK